MTLAGRVALVTGASRGIGKATALELARLGAAVAVVARSEQSDPRRPGSIHETVAAIRALPGGRALAVRADLTHAEEAERAAAETLRELGRIDVLVNNAAYLARSTFSTLAELDAASWQRQLAVNLTAPYVLSRAVAPGMRERGAGRIINVTSVAAVASRADVLNGKRPLAYGPSKAALNRLTELLAGELGPLGIAVVSLDPGSVRSETYELAASGLGVARERSHPVSVPARAIAHLASCPDAGRYAGRCVTAGSIADELGWSPE